MLEAFIWCMLLAIPAICLGYICKINIAPILLVTLILFIPAIIFDWLMFNFSNYYIVNESGILGIWLFDMPIEEYIFAFVFPPFVIVHYELICKLNSSE